jgi:hypothetical protein
MLFLELRRGAMMRVPESDQRKKCPGHQNAAMPRMRRRNRQFVAPSACRAATCSETCPAKSTVQTGWELGSASGKSVPEQLPHSSANRSRLSRVCFDPATLRLLDICSATTRNYRDFAALTRMLNDARKRNPSVKRRMPLKLSPMSSLAPLPPSLKGTRH